MPKRMNPSEVAGKNKKSRHYSMDFLKLGFVQDQVDESKPFCLICSKAFSSMKKNILENHFKYLHPEFVGKEVGYFRDLRDKRVWKKTQHNHSGFQ